MKRKQEGDIQITGRCWWWWGQRNWRLIRVSVGMVGMSGLSTNGLDESLPRQHGMSHYGKKEEKRVHLLQRLFFPSSKGPTLFNCCGSFYSWFCLPMPCLFSGIHFSRNHFPHFPMFDKHKENRSKETQFQSTEKIKR